MQAITRAANQNCIGQACAEMPVSMIADAAERGNAEDISLAEACRLTEQFAYDPGFVILDLRSPADYVSGHLEGAINLEYVSPFSFEKAVHNLDRSKRYLIYCYGGGRSAEAAILMEELGFDKIYDMTQGLNAWRVAECPLAASLAA
jgi:rhodanese-related sulfurtransferase